MLELPYDKRERYDLCLLRARPSFFLCDRQPFSVQVYTDRRIHSRPACTMKRRPPSLN